MSRIFQFLKSKQIFLLAGLLWLLLWILPWGEIPEVQGNLYLVFLIDMLRLGIAIVLFIIPGALLYFLLRQEGDTASDLTGIVPIGFAFSVVIIAVIGLVGRIMGFSFGLVRSAFALTGAIELVLLMLLKPSFALDKKSLLDSLRSVLRNPPLLLAFIFAALMTFNDYLFFIDDTSYLAYLTNWQHAAQLGFKNIVHEANVTENARFWFAMFPMSQALLADLSGVPGILLLGSYLELFLVPIAVNASYYFARTLGLSRKASGFSVLIQLSFFAWMIWEQWPVGTWFFQSMAEDKVAAVFLLSPVLFAFVLRFLQSPTKSSLLTVILSSLALTLTHPVILFYSCAIACGIVLFSWSATKTSWRVVLQLMMVFTVSMLPYAAIRFSDIPAQIGMSFDAEGAIATFQFATYINVVNNVFYGLNPEVLKFVDILPGSNGYTAYQLFRLFPVVITACAGVLAFINVKKGVFYWYVISCTLLVLFAALPYTGWILGYFVSPRMISRASWFSPLGLSGVLVLILVRNWLKSLRVIDDAGKIKLFERLRLTTELLGIGGCLAFAAPVLASSLFFHAPSYFEKLDYYRQLAQIGAYIDENTSHQVTGIALVYWDTQLLPGVSAHTVLISFREETDRNGFSRSFSLDETHERIYASNAIRSLDRTTSSVEQCYFIRKFHVRFVLARQDNAVLYKNIVNECEIAVENVFETDIFELLELK